MAKLYVMCGLAFSGKSTLARKIAEHTKADLIAFDKLWVEEESRGNVLLGAEGWRYIRDLAQRNIGTLLEAGHDVVYDDNNPRKEHRDEVSRVAKEGGAKKVLIYLDTPLDVIRTRETINRVSQERHEVEVDNFDKVANDMEIPTKDEKPLIFKPTTDLTEFLEAL